MLFLSSLSLLPLASTAFHPPTKPSSTYSFPTISSSQWTEFSWSSLTPSTSLNYTSCYADFECARLTLPLDYLNSTTTTSTQTIALAIIRLPSLASDEDEDGGTILFNPGGPGGSGVDFLLKNAHRLRQILDSPGRKFELLSFDPRGMHRSTPTLTCFETELDREVWNLKLDAVGNLDTGTDAMRTYWAATKGLGKLCKDRAVKERKEKGEAPRNKDEYKEAEGYIGSFMSTPSVATDMLRIVEAVDEQKLAKQLVRSLNPDKGASDHLQKPITWEVQDRKENRPPPLLQYWGFSYGTILGQFFATLYPDRVGRIVLDGVADADDFVRTGWKTNLQDSEKTLASFWEYCFTGGFQCPLYATADNSPAAIAARVGDVLAQLRREPRPITYRGTSALVTYSDLRNLIFETLYDPWGNSTSNPGYDVLANIFATLLLPEDDNADKVAEVVGPYIPSLTGLSGSESGNNGGESRCGWIPPARSSKLEASPAVFCTDGVASARNDTFEDFAAKYRLLSSQSPTVGANWAKIPTMCHTWPFRAEWRYAGPFLNKRTKIPILLVGNEADPVTPVRNAEKIAAKEEQRPSDKEGPGATVLLQEGPGHCSLAGKSTCTEYFIRRYFENGSLPPEGTKCRLDCVPWDWDLTGDCREMQSRQAGLGGLEELREGFL